MTNAAAKAVPHTVLTRGEKSQEFDVLELREWDPNRLWTLRSSGVKAGWLLLIRRFSSYVSSHAYDERGHVDFGSAEAEDGHACSDYQQRP